MQEKVCYFKCVDETHEPICLQHLKPVIIGRGPHTKIKDKRLSRQQLKLIADCAKETVQLTQIGGNPSCVDGKELKTGSTAVLKNGSEVHLLPSAYLHKIIFNKDKKKTSTKQTTLKFERVHDVPTNAHEPSKRRNTDEPEGPNKKRIRPEEQPESIANDSEENERTVKEKLNWLRSQAAKKRKSNESIKHDEKTDVQNNVADDNDDTGHTSNVNKACGEAMWEEHGKLIVHTSKGVSASRKIAGFDIDGTIITTKSGKVFAQNTDDWRINFQNIPKKIQSLYKEGFKIVFFTNQLGIGRGKLKVADVKKKFESILTIIDVPVQIFIATGYGEYRKPATGMWDHLVKKANDGVPINIKFSFYVGDAAGRPALWSPGKKKDFSKSDRLFALNIGIKFQTPEEYFLGYPSAKFDMPEFNPKSFNTTKPLFKQPNGQLISNTQEVIVLVGSPASGKSTFVNTHLIKNNYVHVNRDTLGSWQKCVSECNKTLKSGKSVVIDNTNPDVESRKRYISCAKAASVGCRCFVFTPSLTHCFHNERFRQLTQTPSEHAPLADMIFHSYKNKFVYPTMAEGFQEVLEVNFIVNYSNDDHRTLYEQYLLEK